VYEVARPASPTQELGWWASAWRGRLCFVTLLANKDKHEYGHRCDQQDGEHDGPNQRRKRSRLFVMVCHRGYSRRQLFANAAIAASRVAVCRSRDYPAWVLDVERAGRRFGRSGLIMVLAAMVITRTVANTSERHLARLDSVISRSDCGSSPFLPR
jgi:hypothetical protein